MKPSHVLVVMLALTGRAYAQKPLKVTINHITEEGVGKPAGTITLRPGKKGLEMMADLKGLPAGEHGFHLHENGSCDPADKAGVKTAGLAAGAHFDPDATKVHKGPGGGGHKGDLPKLVFNKNRALKGKFTVAGLTLEDVAGRALMIHDGGDNYSDTPAPLGGGGGRVACGVIPALPESSPAK